MELLVWSGENIFSNTCTDPLRQTTRIIVSTAFKSLDFTVNNNYKIFLYFSSNTIFHLHSKILFFDFLILRIKEKIYIYFNRIMGPTSGVARNFVFRRGGYIDKYNTSFIYSFYFFMNLDKIVRLTRSMEALRHWAPLNMLVFKWTWYEELTNNLFVTYQISIKKIICIMYVEVFGYVKVKINCDDSQKKELKTHTHAIHCTINNTFIDPFRI